MKKQFIIAVALIAASLYGFFNPFMIYLPIESASVALWVNQSLCAMGALFGFVWALHCIYAVEYRVKKKYAYELFTKTIELVKEIIEMKKETNEQKTKKLEFKNDCKDLIDQVFELKNKLNKYKRNNLALMRKNKEFKILCENLVSDNLVILDNNNQLDKKNKELDSENQRIKRNLSRLKAEAVENIDVLTNSITTKDVQIEKLIDQTDELKAKLKAANRKVSSLSGNLAQALRRNQIPT